MMQVDKGNPVAVAGITIALTVYRAISVRIVVTF